MEEQTTKQQELFPNAKKVATKKDNELPVETAVTTVQLYCKAADLLQQSAITLVEKGSRNSLNEGRSFQLGYAFAKRLEDNTFETVNAISACKDYLNDTVWSEHTGKDCQAYGYTAKKLGLFENEKFGFLAMRILPYQGYTRGSSVYPEDKIIKDEENLRLNYKNMEAFMNWIEDELKVGAHTIIRQTANNPDVFLVSMPIFWCQTTHLISMFTLFLRGSQLYKGMQDMSPERFMNEFNEPSDKVNWGHARTRFEYFRKYGVVIVKPEDVSSAGNYVVHNAGICSLKLPPTPEIPEGVVTKSSEVVYFSTPGADTGSYTYADRGVAL